MSFQANSENSRRGSLWWVLWAGIALFCFAAAVYFSGRERQYVNETIRLRQQLESAATQLAEWREASAILSSDPEAMTFRAQYGGISAGVIASPKRGVLLFASHLPPLPAGKVFAMWIEPTNQRPVAAGVFQANANGSAIHIERNAFVSGVPAFMITIENESGAAQPTGEAIFKTPIGERPGH